MIYEQDEVLLQAYLDGELSEEESARVELRLANSEEWRRAEQEMRELLGRCSQQFAALDDDDPVLQRELAAAPVGAPATVVDLESARRRRRGWQTPLLALVAASALVAVGLATFSDSRTPADTRTVAAGSPDAVDPPRPDPTPVAPDPAPRPDTSPIAVPPESDSAGARPVVPPSRPPATDLPAERIALPGIELAGLTPTSSAVDTTFGIEILRETYEVRPGVLVTLEAVEADDVVATRSGGQPVTRVDTATTVQPLDSGLALVWRLPSGVTVRLLGDLPEAELRALRERVRVNRGQPR